MFLYIFIILIFLIFILNLLINNILFWWTIFLLLTLLYLFLRKSKGSLRRILNYFIIQEFMGLLFLIFSGFIFQFLIVMIKVGVSPFHFWIYSVVGSLNNFILIWFLTFQKLPFIPILMLLFNYMFFYLLFLGLFLCYLQIYVLKNSKFLFSISSTESFNWLLFGVLRGFISLILISFYYLFRIVFLITFINSNSRNFILLETSLVFLNIPFRVSFFLKIFILKLSFFVYDIFLLFLLIIIFFSSLSLIRWFTIFRLKNSKIFKDYYSWSRFIIYYIFFIVFF